MTLVILGCALPQFSNWFPLLVLIFYCLAPIPTLIGRRYNDSGSNNSCMEMAIFLTMGIVVSAFALPIVLARSPVGAPTIEWGACYLVLSGNVVVYLTMLGFFITFDNEDLDYSMW
ncbi:leptin receptor gene-related protein [Cloeon dipterum]